jgi:transcriptional regulator GlxA family with amidase domain
VHFDFAPGVPLARQALEHRAPYEVRLPGGIQVPRCQKLPAHGRVEQELLELVAAWSTGPGLGELAARACLMRVLVTLLRNLSAPRGEREMDRARMEKAVAFLDSADGHQAGVPQMAAAADLSVSHFTRLFRKWTGFAPVDYQRRQRVARARELLAEPSLSVKEIAARVGFDDPYHFSRVFRQVDGLSPLHYREAVLAGRRK